MHSSSKFNFFRTPFMRANLDTRYSTRPGVQREGLLQFAFNYMVVSRHIYMHACIGAPIAFHVCKN